MGDRYRTADGWAVEVIELSATPDRNDGERLKVTYCGFFVALVHTVAELERWFPLADFRPEMLALRRHLEHGLAGPARAVGTTRESAAARQARNAHSCAASSRSRPVPTLSVLSGTFARKATVRR